MGELGPVGPCADRAVPIAKRDSSQVRGDRHLRAAGTGDAWGGWRGARRMASQCGVLLAERAAFRRDQRRGAYQHRRSRPAQPRRRSEPARQRTDAQPLVQYCGVRAAGILHGWQRPAIPADRSLAAAAGPVGLQVPCTAGGDTVGAAGRGLQRDEHAELRPARRALGTPTFGRISSTGNSIARQMQFAARYVF